MELAAAAVDLGAGAGAVGGLHLRGQAIRAVAHAAAENLNKVTLELGGKSPQIVFPDAELDAAANGVVAPSVPCGGFGLSGLGRENGVDVVNEYLESQSVWIELTGSTRDPFTLG